jgi:hypothetical protein
LDLHIKTINFVFYSYVFHSIKNEKKKHFGTNQLFH